MGKLCLVHRYRPERVFIQEENAFKYARCCFSRNGKNFACVFQKGIFINEVEEKVFVVDSFEESDICTCLAWAMDSEEILIGGKKSILWYNVKKRKRMEFNLDVKIDKSSVVAVDWIDSKHFISAHESGYVYIYNLHREQENIPLMDWKEQENYNPMLKFPCITQNGVITAMKLSPNKNLCALGTSSGLLVIFHLKEKRIYAKFKSYYGKVLCLCWTPDNKYLLAGGEDDLITMYNVNTKFVKGYGVGHHCFVRTIVFDFSHSDNDHYRFVSAGEDGFICFWSIERFLEENTQPLVEQSTPTTIQCPSVNQTPNFEPVHTVKAGPPILDLSIHQEMIAIIGENYLLRIFSRSSSK